MTEPDPSQPSEKTRARLLRAVAAVDLLPVRGAADELIAPMRPLLAALKPPRPLTFGRLMFQPIERLIVDGPRWQPGMTAIPRTALLRLVMLVRNIMGTKAQQIDAMLAGRNSADREAVRRVGGLLWPAASLALGSASVPADWTQTTPLSVPDFTEVTRGLTEMLALSDRILALQEDVASGSPNLESRLRSVLAGALGRGEQAFSLTLALLLSCMPGDGRVLDIGIELAAATADQALKGGPNKAVNFVFSELENAMDTALSGKLELGAAADAMAAIAVQCTGLQGWDHREDWRERIRRIRARVDSACRERFETVMERQLLAPLTRLPPQPGAESLGALESIARELIRFHQAGRSPASARNDPVLVQFEQWLRTKSRDELPLSVIERARLIEIMRGPEAGIAYLREADEAPGDTMGAEPAQAASGPSRSPASTALGNAQAR